MCMRERREKLKVVGGYYIISNHSKVKYVYTSERAPSRVEGAPQEEHQTSIYYTT